MFSRNLGRFRQPSNMALAALVVVALAAIGGLAVSRYSIAHTVATSMPKEATTLDDINPASFSPRTREILLNLEVNSGILAAQLDSGPSNQAAMLGKAAGLVAESSQLMPQVPAPLRTILDTSTQTILSDLHRGKTEQASRDLRSMQATLQGLRTK